MNTLLVPKKHLKIFVLFNMTKYYIYVSIKFVLLPKLKFNSFFNLKLSSTAEKKSTIILSSAFERMVLY